jgi:ERCC4-type nuclease
MSQNSEPQFAHCPFNLIIDTREQAPYSFRDIDQLERYGGGTLIIPTVKAALETGDYSIQGFTDSIAIERKELGDFLNCTSNDRDRFERQLERLNGLKYGAVMVEADWSTILRGNYPNSRVKPESVRGSVVSWQVDYFPKIHWWFVMGRRTAEVMTYRILDRFYRGQVK